jgi:hypothetical protein
MGEKNIYFASFLLNLSSNLLKLGNHVGSKIG